MNKNKLNSFVSNQHKSQYKYFFGDGIKELRNYVIQSRSVGKYVVNIKDFAGWKDVKNLKESGFFDKFGHPQISTWGYIRNSKNEIYLNIYNGFTKNPISPLGNNIFIKKLSNHEGEERNMYYNISQIAISSTLGVLKKRSNFDNSFIINSIEDNVELQNRINLDLESKVDLILNNNIKSINLNNEFMIEQHFKSCVAKVDHICDQCIFIEEKYGIIKVTSEIFLY